MGRRFALVSGKRVSRRGPARPRPALNGSTISTPHVWKSRIFRVATAAPRTRAMADEAVIQEKTTAVRAWGRARESPTSRRLSRRSGREWPERTGVESFRGTCHIALMSDDQGHSSYTVSVRPRGGVGRGAVWQWEVYASGKALPVEKGTVTGAEGKAYQVGRTAMFRLQEQASKNNQRK
jgi:hypothetical protein